MSDAQSPIPFRRRENGETVLAKNLVAARLAAGLTQEALSAASGISRATIAQLETGVSDPRLSTLEALAAAIRLPLASLLLGGQEVCGLVGLADRLSAAPLELSPADTRQLRRWIDSGMLRDRAEAVRLVAQRAAAIDGLHPLAVLFAALFAAYAPDAGATIGAAWGELIATASAKHDPSAPGA